MTRFRDKCEDVVSSICPVLQILFWAIIFLIFILIIFTVTFTISLTFGVVSTFIPTPLYWLGRKLVPTEFESLHSSIPSGSLTDMMAIEDLPFPYSRIPWLHDLIPLRALAIRQQMGREVWSRILESEVKLNKPAKQMLEQLKAAMSELDGLNETQPLIQTFHDYSEPGLHDKGFIDRFATRLWQTVDPGIPRVHVEMPLIEDFISYRHARDRQEKPVDSWHQVWFSKTAGPEYAAHWLLVIDGKKYELRRTSKEDRRRLPTRKNQKYTFLTDDAGDIDISQREVFLERPPRVSTSHGDFYVYLIGWTCMKHEQIVHICEELMMTWRYHYFWSGPGKLNRGNCQDFLRRVANRIVPESKRALDWNFFFKGELGLWEKSELEDALNCLGDSGGGWVQKKNPTSLWGTYVWQGILPHAFGYI